MTLGKFAKLVVWIAFAAVFALTTRDHVVAFQSLRRADPSANIWDYLVTLGPYFWAGVLGYVGLIALVAWWQRLREPEETLHDPQEYEAR